MFKLIVEVTYCFHFTVRYFSILPILFPILEIILKVSSFLCPYQTFFQNCLLSLFVIAHII